MDNVLLLGGTGFIGSSLVKKLDKTTSLKLLINNTDVKTTAEKFRGNILKKESFSNEIRENEIIVNFIGQTSSDESEFINSNIIGGINLLNSCIHRNIKKIILISSINVYGENLESASKENDDLKPKTFYGLIKMITEQMYEYFSRKYGLNVTILRLAGVYGPNKKNGFLSELIKSTKDSTVTPICYNHGKQQRDMLYIDDVIDCILNAMEYQNDGFDIFNISSGKRYSMNELISMIEKITKTKISVKYSSQIPDEKCIWANNEKAKKLLKFEPKTEIENGLESTISLFFNKL